MAADVAVLEKPSVEFKPQTVKISSKRQITIPAALYRDMGFTQYAWVERTDEGLLIKPIDVEDEDLSVYVLRRLVEQGFEGEELIERYKEANTLAVNAHRIIEESERQLEAGEVSSAREMQQLMRERYDA